jgi:hypothetical protein
LAFAKSGSPALNKRVIVRDTKPPEGKDWSSPEGAHMLRLIRRQIIVHLQISNPNILPLLGVTSTLDGDGKHGHPLSIVMPLADRGHALKYLGGMGRGEQRVEFLKIVSRVAIQMHVPGVMPIAVYSQSVHIAAALHYLHTIQLFMVTSMQ